jgi:hypothetical protein
MKGVELLKIGHLMDHYELHQERNSDATLLSFIKEHYFNSSIDFEKEHQEMPFKVGYSLLISLFIENKVNLQIDLDSFFEDLGSVETFAIQTTYFFNSLYSIWNPPRN